MAAKRACGLSDRDGTGASFLAPPLPTLPDRHKLSRPHSVRPGSEKGGELIAGEAGKRSKQHEAAERGRKIRAELRTRLETGPGSATDLLPFLPADVSLSEVEFQLDRLAEKGEATGAAEEPYRLI